MQQSRIFVGLSVLFIVAFCPGVDLVRGDEAGLAQVATKVECAFAPLTMELWPAGAPGAKGDGDKDRPTITVYRPASGKATGIAVVVCPGGGYGGLAMDHEGKQVAVWLNSFGVAGIVLNYRHNGKGYRKWYSSRGSCNNPRNCCN